MPKAQQMLDIDEDDRFFVSAQTCSGGFATLPNPGFEPADLIDALNARHK